MRRHAALVVLLSLLVLPAAVHAATFVVPPDEWMIDDAAAIVSGTVTDAYPRYTDEGEIETVYTITVDEALKGAKAPKQLTVVEFGGHIEGRWMVMAGAPKYHLGQRYLFFLTSDRLGRWTTHNLTLGRFAFERRNGADVLTRDGAEIHGWDIHGNTPVETARRADDFLSFIRQRVAGRIQAADYFVDGVVRTAPAVRRQIAADAAVEPNFADYDFDDASQVGAEKWSDDSGSNISYSISGSAAGGNTRNLDDGEERIIEEDPNGDIPGAFTGSGIVATAFYAGGPDHSFEGQTYITITESDVVTQNGLKDSSFGQNRFRTTLVHELGHTLGLRHSNQTPDGGSCSSTPLPCTSTAVMNSSVASLNGVLQNWDEDAAAAVYGDGGNARDYTDTFCSNADCHARRTDSRVSFRKAKEGCTPPSITAQPQSKSISLGDNTSLSVTAAGSSPLTYQWYIGNTGDTSTPTGTNSKTISVSPTATTSYWVRVSNTCTSGPAADSATATVTVTCANAAITTHPANKTITAGQNTQLSVSATGSNRTYQWFIGNSGDTSQPTGTNSSNLSVAPNVTTKYWVRVSASCGPPANSNTATVTVTACADIDLGAPTATPGAGAGQFTLNIPATSTATLSFEWFRGETPGIGGTKVASTQSFFTTVTQVTSFWAKVTNSCGRVAVSSLVTIAPCTLPSIITQPADQTVNMGGSATLTVAASAGASVKWYRGAVGDKSAQVGNTASFNTGALTETTLYWAEVSNTCGAVASRQVTVTVEPLTDTLQMLGTRFTVVVEFINQFANPPAHGRLLGRSLSHTTLSDTAIFTFGDPKVVELMVRLSDARPFDNHIHLFYGGLSDIEFFINVTDTLTGVEMRYHKPAFQLVGQVDRTSFVSIPGGSMFQSGVDALMAQTAARAIAPQEDSDTIFMLNGRYRVRMRYRNQFVNPPTEGYLLSRSIASSNMTETAVFFGNPESVEWMVRFSDARPFDEHIHFYHGGLTDLELTVEVTDTVTGLTREYAKPGNTLVGEVDRLTWVP